MLMVILWSVLFSIVTAASVVMLGSKEFVEGQMGLARLTAILFNWKFIIGAILAFGARMLFVLTNNAIYKIPHLSSSSTTLTTLINSAAVILVIIANFYFLGEKINATQGMGAFMIIFGIFLITR